MPHSKQEHTNDTTLSTHDDTLIDPDLSGPRRAATISDETATLSGPIALKTTLQRGTELYFIPIPKHLRHDPENPPHFGLFLNMLFGLASTFFNLGLLAPKAK
ncbi:hypothetical protein NM688_g4085 [Phlebia brevispora]|uniref:Uncharacterized protein n=1 Tax=Phlebia brevispora TaxID=194682 RepID=A0ACC1T446_9APHY|nr:hypothetical protein NM688_g4085 [Phlebia brevispora]